MSQRVGTKLPRTLIPPLQGEGGRASGRSVVVRINDRGPFVRGRVIDLTPAGARALGFSGLAPVQVARVSD